VPNEHERAVLEVAVELGHGAEYGRRAVPTARDFLVRPTTARQRGEAKGWTVLEGGDVMRSVPVAPDRPPDPGEPVPD
jgi:hypothetical protein